LRRRVRADVNDGNEGIMTLRLTQLHLAAGVLAIAMVSLTGASAHAFTTETLSAGSDGNSQFADPDEQVNTAAGRTIQPFGPSGPMMQFGGRSGPMMTPYGFQGGGANSTPPDPYARPLGFGN
jgi:hypothetical protein